MSDPVNSSEVFETPQEAETVVIDAPPAPTKPKPRKKRELTDAQRDQVRANLAKGRATALANRRKKAILKRKEKEDRQRQLDIAVMHAMSDTEPLTTRTAAAAQPPSPPRSPEPRAPAPPPPAAPSPPAPPPQHVISTYDSPPW